MTIRTKVEDDYRYSHYLLTEHDNTRPRIVGGWDLLERILNVNFRQVAEGDANLVRFWIWNAKVGRLDPMIRIVKCREFTEEGDWVTTWAIKRMFPRRSTIGEFDVRTLTPPPDSDDDQYDENEGNPGGDAD